MIERFTCPAGSVVIDYDPTLLTADVRIFFHTWRGAYEERAVSSTADALHKVIARISCEREALPIVEQILRRIEDLKQGELFAEKG
jgi:hypothetical protein